MIFCKQAIVISFCLLITTPLSAQELFPQTEPASNIPKNVLGVRLANEFYNELGVLRSWQGYRFTYGLSPKWSLSQTFSFANHHGKKLPVDFIKTDGNSGSHTHGTAKGIKYPYTFENLWINVKYRFLSIDGEHKHFRMASYLDLAGGNEAHDEAEPNFTMGDNSGLGGGLVSTLLNNKFAASLTTGFLLPYRYSQYNPDITIKYGKAYNYSFSLGYLLLPRTYKNYKQTNVNVYVEFMGKSYNSATITKDGLPILITDAPTLVKGNYIDIRPSIQFVLHSNTRLDFTVSTPLIKHSYVKTYPVFYINVQHYFFL